jgi:nicotinate phosphoribosyltransferase
MTDQPHAPQRELALFTDLYELTMLQAYLHAGMEQEAVFTLSVRRLPVRRNFLLACGLEHVLEYLETLQFSTPALEYLATTGQFAHAFLERLAALRFTGDVYAVPEGTPVFANEPILEVVAPLPQAQLIETYLMNQVNLATTLASKAVRVVHAARGRRVVDFGARRMHGTDAALKAARAFHIAGVDATSNVLAGRRYDLPIAGTMAHSFVQACEGEGAAFRTFLGLYPETVLLVDTYDTLAAVRKVIDLARELGDAFRVRAIRIDSGDLAELAARARAMLDEAGLQSVGIFVSGNLDEDTIEALLARGAPIDGFGVGTAMGVSLDAPALDIAYKLVAYAGRGRLKLSAGKPVLPGRKQVFRREANGRAVGDVIGRSDEELPGRPLLRPVMRAGRRLPEAAATLEESRRHAREELARLPEALHALAPAQPPYPVTVSAALLAYHDEVAREVAGA